MRKVIAIIFFCILLSAGMTCFASAESDNVTVLDCGGTSTGSVTFTIPAGQTTAYVAFTDGSNLETMIGELQGVEGSIQYSFSGRVEDLSKSLEEKSYLNDRIYEAESERWLTSDGKIYFRTGINVKCSEEGAVYLKFKLKSAGTSDLTLTLNVSKHIHDFETGKSSKVDKSNFETTTIETGKCECGYAYTLIFVAKVAGYRTNSLSASIDADYESWYLSACHPDFDNIYPYHVDSPEYADIVRSKAETDSLGTHTGTFTITDEAAALNYGGAVHEFDYEVRKRMWVEPNTRYVYTGNTIKLNPKDIVHIDVNIKGEKYPDPVRGVDYELYLNGKKALNMKKVGTYTLTAKSLGDFYLFGKKNIITVIPKTPGFKVTSAKGNITIRASKAVSKYGGNKYQICYKREKGGAWKKVTTTKRIKTIKKLKKGKKYCIKVRTIKKTKKKTYYGKWSKEKIVKIR